MKKILMLVVIGGIGLGIFLGKYSLSGAFYSPQPSSQFSNLIHTVNPTPTPPIVGIPTRFIIPKLHIDTTVESVGLDAQQRMDVPQSWNNVGWYQYGPRPGEPGNSVIDGHLDTPTGAAVFWNLSQLTPGDQVIVMDQNQKTYTFTVTQKAVYADANFPLQTVFGSTGKSMLNLITCEGTWNRQQHNYSDRLVIFTNLSQ